MFPRSSHFSRFRCASLRARIERPGIMVFNGRTGIGEEKRMKTARILVGALALLLLAAPARADILIAAAGPVTGPLASLGEQMLAGARQAVADINEAGGVLGQRLGLVVSDDQCDPKQAVSVANQLSARDIALVVGHFCSGATIPAAQVYEQEGVVMISPAATNPDLTEQGHRLIFRTCGRDDRQGYVAGEFIAKRFKGKRIAVLHDKSAYGKGIADATRDTLHRAGVTEALYDAYTAGEKDYTALVSKLKATGIEAVFVGGYHTEAGLILRQMRGQGVDAAFIGGDALVLREFWSVAGDAAENVYFTFVKDPRRNPLAAEVLARFAAQGKQADGYVLYTYAAVEAWAEAAKRAGTLDAENVAAMLHGQSVETVIGKLTFDPKGDVDLPTFEIYRWSKGDYTLFQEMPN
jgi:branched-chain amino acid transport system substrate-binding protein